MESLWDAHRTNLKVKTYNMLSQRVPSASVDNIWTREQSGLSDADDVFSVGQSSQNGGQNGLKGGQNGLKSNQNGGQYSGNNGNKKAANKGNVNKSNKALLAGMDKGRDRTPSAMLQEALAVLDTYHCTM